MTKGRELANVKSRIVHRSVPQHMDQCSPQQCPGPTILPVSTPTCACLRLQSLIPFIFPATSSVPNLHLLSGGCWPDTAHLHILPPSSPARPGFSPRNMPSCIPVVKGMVSWMSMMGPGCVHHHVVLQPCLGGNMDLWHKHRQAWLHILLLQLIWHVALGKQSVISSSQSPCLSVWSN